VENRKVISFRVGSRLFVLTNSELGHWLFVTVLTTTHFLCNLRIKVECYITLGRKGLPGTNTLSYWAYL